MLSLQQRLDAKEKFRNCTHFYKNIGGMITGLKFGVCDCCFCETVEFETSMTKLNDVDMIEVAEYLGLNELDDVFQKIRIEDGMDAVDVEDISEEFYSVCNECSENLLDEYLCG